MVALRSARLCWRRPGARSTACRALRHLWSADGRLSRRVIPRSDPRFAGSVVGTTTCLCGECRRRRPRRGRVIEREISEPRERRQIGSAPAYGSTDRRVPGVDRFDKRSPHDCVLPGRVAPAGLSACTTPFSALARRANDRGAASRLGAQRIRREPRCGDLLLQSMTRPKSPRAVSPRRSARSRPADRLSPLASRLTPKKQTAPARTSRGGRLQTACGSD